MDHTALDQGMFWVGAMFVFVPLISAGVVIALWWRWKKSLSAEKPGDDPAHPVS